MNLIILFPRTILVVLERLKYWRRQVSRLMTRPMACGYLALPLAHKRRKEFKLKRLPAMMPFIQQDILRS